MKRTIAARENKSWRAKEVDVRQVIEKACVLDGRLACMIAMMAAFGLRAKEAVEIRPERAARDGKGNHLLVEEGTKGSRPRFVDIRTEDQRKTLEWAVSVASKTKSGRLRWPSETWKQAQNHLYRECRKLGLTWDQLGVTLHGLRHQFAQDGYRFVSGLPTPIDGGALERIDRWTHRAAAGFVSHQLGHCRPYVGGTYYGSYGHKLRCVPENRNPEERPFSAWQSDCYRYVSVSVGLS